MITCSRCFGQVRPCSPHCTMGGWVHVHTDKHLCDPGMAFALLRRPDMWNVPWMFAHVRRQGIN